MPVSTLLIITRAEGGIMLKIVKVRTICDALDRATLRGAREDWGEESEGLFQMLKFLATHFGEQVVELANDSDQAILTALRSIGAPLEKITCLSVLEKRLAAPFRPVEVSEVT